MARRTIAIGKLYNWVDRIMRIPDDRPWGDIDSLTPRQAYRRAVASVLESVLHDTGNYGGFSYINADGTYLTDFIEGQTDETRRAYAIRRPEVRRDFEAAREADPRTSGRAS